MATKGKKKDNGADNGSGSWMVTFSDLSTLLLTFFVLLLSMSSMDDLKLRSSFYTFTSSCGILQFKEYGQISQPKEKLIEGLIQELKDALIIREEDQESSSDFPSDIVDNPFKEAGDALVFQNAKDGFKLTFGQEMLFDSGSAEIKDGVKPVLALIAKFMRIAAYQVYIDGHTDDLPIHTETYPSNDDLSLARAYSVMAYLVKKEGVSPKMIALAGYGKTFPLEANNSPEARVKNRRVEIIFKNQKYF